MTIDFAKYSSIGIGPICDVLEIDAIGDYSDYYIIGRANNLLIGNCDTKLAVLGKAFDYIQLGDDGLIYVGCATKSSKLFNYTKKHNLANLEFLSHLPGTIGGLIKMNAGLKEWEIFNHIVKIKTKDGYISKDDIKYGYRTTNIKDIVYEAVFSLNSGFDRQKVEIFTKMRSNQPKEKSAGSCFKNPVGDYAGRLIESVGLKGYKIGDMGFSQIHANFLVNYGNGTYEDALSLIELAQSKILKQYGIKLEPEVIIL
ncbi:UDP-N-acetylmuramate dehydrogenase [Arcobacter sp. FWKO B]|uniref:UDP-N-acetylmuramate dehydrogenase n=1 Tax=Arcobacter sp. FWKO B TaxID=2593672 RepID=UPI0018A55C78|nr:UDP-N-acetylmuramate dehydrogenase [Arcobacter sp. FWKO B]QOG12485.1 UDP-N-acetylmuramate dehydrogenase [Arcobacter sp. FWKO B]